MTEYIKRYCNLGFKVFPVVLYIDAEKKVVKSPMIEGWKTKATSNYDEAIKMFQSTNAKSIGIVTGNISGISVLDIDVKNSENGFLSLEQAGIDLPFTACSLTPSGGRHYIFKYTDKMKTSVKVLPGVDCRNDAGFIVVAPSAYPDGRIYEWIIEQEPWTMTPIEAPDQITGLFKLKIKESSGPSQVPDRIKSGERNDVLYRQACSLREKGLTEEELFGTLQIFNKTRCEEPVSLEELAKIATSAAKHEKGDDKTKRKAKRLLFTVLQILNKDDSTNKLFGLNEFTHDTEFLKSPPWDPLQPIGYTLTDTDMISLKVYMSTKYNLEPPIGIIGEAIAYEAKNCKFHPVRDFIRGLTWDGKARLDSWLTKAAGSPENAYIKAVGRKILIAAVARVFSPGCKFDHMLVLEGEQGIGKSMLVSALAGQWFTELNITEEDKDVVEYMRGRWIIEVPEMVCARKTEVDHLKAFITKTKDRVRLAYRRNATDFPRQSILIGTINPSGDNTYLRDDTGGRRFWPVMCTNIDIEWLKSNRDQLIAEAFEVYKHGQEDLYIKDQEVIEIAKAHQEERQQEDVWMQYVLKFIKENIFPEGFTVADLAQKSLNISPERIDRSVQIRLGLILKRLDVPFNKNTHSKMKTYHPKKEQKEAENALESNW